MRSNTHGPEQSLRVRPTCCERRSSRGPTRRHRAQERSKRPRRRSRWSRRNNSSGSSVHAHRRSWSSRPMPSLRESEQVPSSWGYPPPDGERPVAGRLDIEPMRPDPPRPGKDPGDAKSAVSPDTSSLRLAAREYRTRFGEKCVRFPLNRPVSRITQASVASRLFWSSTCTAFNVCAVSRLACRSRR